MVNASVNQTKHCSRMFCSCST